MIKWLIEIILGNFCKHQWKLHKRMEAHNSNNDIVKVTDTLICEKCGKIKQIDL